MARGDHSDHSILAIKISLLFLLVTSLIVSVILTIISFFIFLHTPSALIAAVITLLLLDTHYLIGIIGVARGQVSLVIIFAVFNSLLVFIAIIGFPLFLLYNTYEYGNGSRMKRVPAAGLSTGGNFGFIIIMTETILSIIYAAIIRLEEM